MSLEPNSAFDFVYSGVIQCEEDDLYILKQNSENYAYKNDVLAQLSHSRFKGNETGDGLERRALLFFEDFNLERMLRHDNFITSNSWLARRRVLTDILLEDPHMEVGEDCYFLLMVMANFKFAFSGTASSIWNWRSSTLNNSMRSVSAQQRGTDMERIDRRLANIEFPGGYAGHQVLGKGRMAASAATDTAPNGFSAESIERLNSTANVGACGGEPSEKDKNYIAIFLRFFRIKS
jgi:phosphoglycerol transferase